jgi:hypothetical protein
MVVSVVNYVNIVKNLNFVNSQYFAIISDDFEKKLKTNFGWINQ